MYVVPAGIFFPPPVASRLALAVQSLAYTVAACCTNAASAVEYFFTTIVVPRFTLLILFHTEPVGLGVVPDVFQRGF